MTRRLFLDPNGGLVLVRLLDEEGSRTGVQTNLILNGNFFDYMIILSAFENNMPCVYTVGYFDDLLRKYAA